MQSILCGRKQLIYSILVGDADKMKTIFPLWYVASISTINVPSTDNNNEELKGKIHENVTVVCKSRKVILY